MLIATSGSQDAAPPPTPKWSEALAAAPALPTATPGDTRTRIVAPHLAPLVSEERPGGHVHGTVRWDDGTSVAGAEVSLLDQSGAVIGEVLTSDDGTYALEDADLQGTELRVTEPLGDAHQRDLSPLYSGEQRVFDIVLGGGREVVGWVLDGLGDPQPGVLVVLSWEKAQSRWRTLTDAGGGFTFVDVPETPLRVTADGGDLGVASARVAQTEAARREVTLVLEPTGTITVSAAPEVSALGEVTVRCYSAAAHGEDGLWADDLREPEVDEYGWDPVYSEDGVEIASDELDGEGLIEGEHEDLESPSPTFPEIEGMLTKALTGWDSADPEESFVRMALELASLDPRMEAEMREDIVKDMPELANQAIERVAREAVRKVIAEEPRVLDMLGLAAERVRQGESLMTAFQAAEEATRPPPEEVDAMLEAEMEPPEAFEAEPLDPEDAASVEIELAEDVPEYDFEGFDGVDPETETFLDRIEGLREETGIQTIEIPDEERSVVATGRFFQPIPVRGAFEYRVSIRHPDGFELVCGSVFVAPGEDVEVRCGGEAAAVLEGRVVDGRGAPIAGALVEVMPDIYEDGAISATTDERGRYVLELSVSEAKLVTVYASNPRVADEDEWIAERRSQNASPGAHTQVPDLILRGAEERIDFSRPDPFGGVGASVGVGSEGIILQALFEDGPLSLAGAESGDVIVRIGEELGASLSIEDAVALLRGDIGTDVDLTLRSAAGELYDLMVTRGLVTPGGGGAD